MSYFQINSILAYLIKITVSKTSPIKKIFFANKGSWTKQLRWIYRKIVGNRQTQKNLLKFEQFESGIQVFWSTVQTKKIQANWFDWNCAQKNFRKQRFVNFELKTKLTQKILHKYFFENFLQKNKSYFFSNADD